MFKNKKKLFFHIIFWLQALYGAMNSFLGSGTFNELCDKTQIKAWFERMREAVDSRAGAALLQKSCCKRM